MCEPQLTTLLDVLTRRAILVQPHDPQVFDGDFIGELAREAAERGAPVMQGDVAVLPLYGVIFPRANMVTAMSGGTSAEQFARHYAALMEDPDVKAVVLDVDSPGGSVAGTPEAADVMFGLRGRKPVVAQVNHLMASGAYYLASQCDEIVISPSGEAGSIGVVMVHERIGRALEELGIDVTFIHAARFKVEGNEIDELGPETVDYLQAIVDSCYGDFVKAVARGRGVSPDTVRKSYGEGRMMLARDAVAAGLADRVATLDQTVTRLRSAQGRAAGSRRRGELQGNAGIQINPSGLEPEALTAAVIEAMKNIERRGALAPLELEEDTERIVEPEGLEALAAGVLEGTV